jgi:hypothetical protein
LERLRHDVQLDTYLQTTIVQCHTSKPLRATSNVDLTLPQVRYSRVEHVEAHFFTLITNCTLFSVRMFNGSVH